MPKPLPPESSNTSPVQTYLDREAVAQATGRRQTNGDEAKAVPKAEAEANQPAPKPKVTKLTGEPVNITREFHLTASAARTLKTAVGIYEEPAGGSITNSHFLRALLMVIEDALPHLADEAQKLTNFKRPSNAPGYEAEREKFERRLAEAIIAGMRAYGQARRPARRLTDETQE